MLKETSKLTGSTPYLDKNGLELQRLKVFFALEKVWLNEFQRSLQIFCFKTIFQWFHHLTSVTWKEIVEGVEVELSLHQSLAL